MARTTLLLPLAVLVLLPAAAGAQGGGRLVPYAGVSVGIQSLPYVFQGCSPEDRLAAELRGGLARGAFALEGRLAGMREVAEEDCLLANDVPPVPESGVHTLREHPFRSSNGHVAADLRLRVAVPARVHASLSAGAGWLEPAGVPYLLAAAGLRFGGRVRLALDVERNWYRTPSAEVTARWEDWRPVQVLGEEERVGWLEGTGIRLGAEVPFR